MVTREKLQAQARLTPAQMDRLLERASNLQEKARGAAPGRSLDDVKKVGSELDIDAAFIDEALKDLRREEDAAARAREQSVAMRKRAGMVAGGVVVAALALGGVGSMGVRAAADNASLARANLETVVKRQAALVPQLLALGGGEVTGLDGLQKRVEDARDVEEQLRAADALQLAMAQALGKMPPARNDAESQQRLSLQHEMVGATNRISTERRRYEQSLAEWRSAAGGPLGRLGVAVGLAPSPPGR